MPSDGFSGGDKLNATLNGIAARAGGNPEVRVGFLEGAMYPNGTSVAYVAAINEFGATIQREPGAVTIYRKVKGGKFLRGGRFVKKAQSNFATDHAHDAYTIHIPPRPFFRNMIAAKSREWPAAIATQLRAKDYDARAALDVVGEAIGGQLQASIKALTSPPNAPSTIQRKGFDDPLIDTGYMWRKVDHEVTTGESS
jgi:hypothetical protein